MSLRTPLLTSDKTVNDLEVIKDGHRSLVFLGSAPTVDGEPFLFENAIGKIHDGSVPTSLSQDPLTFLLDIYRFDSQIDPHKGEYRELLHNTATFFRHRDVQNVIVVDDSKSPFRVILFEGVKADNAFVVCEVYSHEGRCIARIKFTSTSDDVEWVFDSVATILAS